MKIELHHEPIVFQTLRPEWNELVKHSGANTPFSLWEFLATWWDVYGNDKLWLVSVRDDSGKLVGIAPLFVNENKILCSVGGLDVTDYCDWIVHTDKPEVYGAIFDFLTSQKTKFIAMSFYNLRPDSATYSALCSIFSKGIPAVQTQVEVTPQIRLPSTLDDYYEMLDKKQRGELRRKMRRAEAGVDEKIDWYVVGVEDDVQTEIQKFFGLMALSSPQKAEFLKNPQHKAFFEALIPRMYEAGVLHLAFLRVDGEAVASYLNFDYDGRIWVYNSGFSYKYESLSTGIVLLVYLIEDAIKRGYSVFDFLRGNETYKYRMGGLDVPLYQLNVTL